MEEFAKQELPARQEFMKSVKGLSAKEAAQKAKEFFKSFSSKENGYVHGGAFWPLSKWAQEGFDSVAIEARTPQRDIMQHNILGRCYRVKIVSTYESGRHGHERGDETRANSSRMEELLAQLIKQHGNAPAASATTVPDAASDKKEEEEEQGTASDSSISSSSSSSSDKKKKKKKKHKDKKDNKSAKKDNKKDIL